MLTPEQREKNASVRAAHYAAKPLSEILREAAGHIDCKCRYPDGNGPPCGRETLANEMRARAASQERIEKATKEIP